MEDSRVWTPQTAESDDQNNISSFPNATSVTDRDKVINIKLDSTQVEGNKSDIELLDGLLTASYCYLCCSKLSVPAPSFRPVLLTWHLVKIPPVLSDLQGKKHATKVRTYIKAFREEKTKGCQQAMPNDKNRFCELCNMVFSSDVVAKSHYEGKVHAKNVRKQSFQSPGKCFMTEDYYRNEEVHLTPSFTQYPADSDRKPSPAWNVELRLDPVASPAFPSSEVNLKDPNKFCSLCSALFNNPQMAVQHYQGRKHQRNHAKQDLLRQLGEKPFLHVYAILHGFHSFLSPANTLLCHVCGVQTNSVEMYNTHMQGSKHQIREKKISDLFKSQPKVYSTFADELADYIQVQKARGITPKTSHGLPHDRMQRKDEDDEEEKHERLDMWDVTEENSAKINLPRTAIPGSWHPSYLHPAWPPHIWDNGNPPPFQPSSGSPQFSSWPMKSGRYRRLSSSSTYSTTSSTSYSSYSTYTSDSDDSECSHEEKRRIGRSGKDGGRKRGNEESDKEEKGRTRQKREPESEESEDERRRKKLKCHSTKRQKESDKEEKQMDSIKKQDTMEAEKETEAHLPAETEQIESAQGKAAQPKNRKEKKKMKGKADTRTEEEKLWDDSILGC
ncbi:zinc finger matrin-type protein 1 [Xenentodon cancila]